MPAEPGALGIVAAEPAELGVLGVLGVFGVLGLSATLGVLDLEVLDVLDAEESESEELDRLLPLSDSLRPSPSLRSLVLLLLSRSPTPTLALSPFPPARRMHARIAMNTMTIRADALNCTGVRPSRTLIGLDMLKRVLELGMAKLNWSKAILMQHYEDEVMGCKV